MIKKDFYSPTPKYWRKWGDFALVLLVPLQLAIPTMPIGSDAQYWTNLIIGLLVVGFKFWTNTKSINKS